MTVTPEQVRKLSEAAGVDEIAALSALERHDGDLLEAMLELERQGRVPPPEGGGFYSTRGQDAPPPGGDSGNASGAPGAPARQGRNWYRWTASSGDELWVGLKDLFRRSMVNRMEIRRKGRMVAGVPLLVLLLLLVCFFWVMAMVLGFGLLLGFRYHFAGPDLDRESMDRAAKKASAAAARAAAQVKAEFERRKH